MPNNSGIFTMNKHQIIGNLGANPVIRTVDFAGKLVKCAQFSVATTERFKDKNGEVHESTDWHNVVLWRGLAEVAEKFLKKGSKVYICGKSKSRTWDKADGSKGYITELIADELELLDRKPEGSGIPAPEVPANVAASAAASSAPAAPSAPEAPAPAPVGDANAPQMEDMPY